MLLDSVVSTLRTDETAALAAAMIIAGAFPDVLSFAARVAGAPHGSPDAPNPEKAARRAAAGACERRPTNAMAVDRGNESERRHEHREAGCGPNPSSSLVL